MKSNTFLRPMAILLGISLILLSASPASGIRGVERIWVQYQPGRQAQAYEALKQTGAQVHYHFASLESYVVTMPSSAVQGLLKNPHVVDIESDPLRYPVSIIPSTVTRTELATDSQVVPYGVDMVQARDIWDANRDGKVDRHAPTGAGRTVCIMDTGLFSGHEDFSGVNVLGGYSQTNDDPALWTFDGHGHGTHVAGTITAANNEVGVVGVTPGTVSLYIIKIFGDDGLWVNQAHASDLVDAAYRCADNGANVISYSASGTQSNRHEERAFNNLYAAGVLTVAAASNEGIEEYHYPASYDSVISVAAIDENYAVADFSQFNDQVELAAPGVDVLSTVPFLSINQLTVEGVTFYGNHIEFAATGTASGNLVDGGRCLTTGDWSGKIVLCERGDISFFEKVMNVENSYATAAVIYNNEPGNFLGTLGEGNSSTIVAISLSQEDGQYLVANMLGKDASIDSSITWNVSGYEAWGGTSMATPHVSAVAALIWSWNPDLTNIEIREALAATAMDLGDPGRDVHYGFGLVQAYDAWVYLGGGRPHGPK